MLYGNIPLDDSTIARLTYKSEKAIETCMQTLIEFKLITQSLEGVYSIAGMQNNPKKKIASD